MNLIGLILMVYQKCCSTWNFDSYYSSELAKVYSIDGFVVCSIG